jgi:hypothetical protein
MAAGLGFKTFATGEVLTAANVNGYLMQGVLVFASAAARDAAITSPQEGQACYLKDTDGVLTYSGSAWVALGGGGGGGMTLLQTLSLTGASTTSSTFTASDYVNYFIVVSQVYVSALSSALQLRFNADTGSNYDRNTIQCNDASISCDKTTGGSNIFLANMSELTGANEKTNGTITISRINDTSTVYVEASILGTLSGSNGQRLTITGGSYNNSAAITSITFLSPSYNFSGGTAYIYGVK